MVLLHRQLALAVPLRDVLAVALYFSPGCDEVRDIDERNRVWMEMEVRDGKR